ncbi:serine/threonine protein kinase [Myxococcus sp. AM001]|nr:serine/threonine protein kinase [Myxococcus sp. AM001]
MDGQSKSASIPLTSQHLVAVPKSGSGWDERYKNLGSLGRGGCAEVFRALDSRTGETVALKVPNESSEELRRFSREVNQLKGLSHENVIEILDASERWYTMRLADGNLTSLAPTLCDEERIEAVSHAAKGLAFVHSKGLVHRDVSPNNILRIDKRWVVSDFGFVKKPKGMSSVPKTQGAFGTLGYVAPEVQAMGAHHATPRSDIYSLGQIVVFITTGKRPGNGSRIEVPRIWESLVEKMTAVAEYERFQTMDEVVESLQEVWDQLKDKRKADWSAGRNAVQGLRQPALMALANIAKRTTDIFREDEIRDAVSEREHGIFNVGLMALRQCGFIVDDENDEGRPWRSRLTKTAIEWCVINDEILKAFWLAEPEPTYPPPGDDNIPF